MKSQISRQIHRWEIPKLAAEPADGQSQLAAGPVGSSTPGVAGYNLFGEVRLSTRDNFGADRLIGSPLHSDTLLQCDT